MVSQTAIRASVQTIDPSRAARLLTRLRSKGKVDERLLASYVRDVKEGRWRLNGAPLVLTDTGEVLDGRLRLLACAQAQVAFTTLVVEGIDSSAYETMDAMRKRTLADVLAIQREKHGRSLAAALRIIWTYLNKGVPGASRPPSSMTLLTLLQDHPEIRDAVMPTLSATPWLPHGCGIALHYLMSQVDPDKTTRFISLIGKPIENDENRPVIILRQALEGLRSEGGNRRQTYILALTIKAFNAFCSGASLKSLRYTPDREAFPQIAQLPSPGPLFDASRAHPTRTAQQDQYARVTAKVIEITPDIAEDMLRDNSLNRLVSSSAISKYARDILAGEWRLNGQTIKISHTGKLLDGQHRLEAVKKARTGFTTVVVNGLDEDSFASLDTGHRRSVSDLLRESGEIHTVMLAAALRWLWMIQNEVVLAVNVSPTNSESLHLLAANPDLRQSLKHVMQIREIMGSGIACALHYTFSQLSAPAANEFFSRLMDGVNLSATSPIYHLRERLIRTRASHRVRLAEAERVALTIKAWNFFRQDRPMHLLAWRTKGATREALPAPV